MNKLATTLAVLLGLTLVGILTWGVVKATRDLTQIIATGINSLQVSE